MSRAYRFYKPDVPVRAMTEKRPCQHNAVPGGAQCMFVAKWTVVYTTVFTDAHEHVRRYCDHHVYDEAAGMRQDEITTSMRIEKIDY